MDSTKFLKSRRCLCKTNNITPIIAANTPPKKIVKFLLCSSVLDGSNMRDNAMIDPILKITKMNIRDLMFNRNGSSDNNSQIHIIIITILQQNKL